MLVAGLLGLAAAVPAQAKNVAQKVSSNSASGASLFHSEALQLTDEALSSLPADHRALFEFGSDDSSSLAARSIRRCKSLPGDRAWPSETIWELLDWVLGSGSLIKTVPLATVCYPSEPNYDSEKCADITNSWTDSHLQ